MNEDTYDSGDYGSGGGGGTSRRPYSSSSRRTGLRRTGQSSSRLRGSGVGGGFEIDPGDIVDSGSSCD